MRTSITAAVLILATSCATGNSPSRTDGGITEGGAGAGLMDSPDTSSALDGGFDGSAEPDTDAAVTDAPPAADAPVPDCTDCRGLYPVGPPVRMCDGLSTDPAVYAGPPELAAGDGTFAVRCQPRTTASAALATAWRVDLVTADGTDRSSIRLGEVEPIGWTDARLIFAHGRFVTAADFDCERTILAFQGCTLVSSFLPDGTDLQRWPLLESPGGRGRAEHALTTLGSSVLVIARDVSASDRAWNLGLDLSVLPLEALVADGGRASPVGLQLRETPGGFDRFGVGNEGLFFTPFAADGRGLAPAIRLAASGTQNVQVVADGDSYWVSLSIASSITVLRLDRSGAEQARVEIPLTVGTGAHALHVADGLVYLVHTGPDPYPHSLWVSVFDADLNPLPERSGSLFDGSPAYHPSIVRDPMTGTYAIAYNTYPEFEVELRRFSHRPE